MKNNTHCALLFICVNKENDDLYNKYTECVKHHNNNIHNPFPNAGFDLFFPEKTAFTSSKSQFVSMNIKCEMRSYDENSKSWKPISYYMYPRSSISKTPLMLANSVGVIDSGYRGNIIGAFRNISGDDEPFVVEQYTRLLQICAPDLRPIIVQLVDADFFEKTDRGEGGFGSTGLGIEFLECNKN
jgi:dUTP pyrophosphatase